MTRIKSMQIHQLSLAYLVDEDRVLLRINTQQADEFRLWLTRRMSLRLLPLMDKVMADQVARDGAPDTSHLASADEATRRMMAEFQGSDALKGADFDTPYETGARNLPLGPDPVLVTEVTFKPTQPGLMQVLFSEILKGRTEPRKLQVVVDRKLMHSFRHLLRNCVAKAQWSESVTATGAAAPPPSAEGAGEKPRYLN